MLMVRTVTLEDASALAAIYNHYIDHTIITFEEESLSEKAFAARIEASITAEDCWLVLEDKGVIVGYAYSCPWKSRSAYRYTHEITIYLAPTMGGKGFGSQLLNALLQQLSKTTIRNLIAVIALPNAASVALHEAFGMQKVAHFAKVGYKFDQWVDVGYWQLSLPEKQNHID